ncbi:glycoside hydrolase family 2 TIM barrel-domain containing protein [Nocardia sp. NPDC050697]|uniref:glycoside hydrolase family 2 TIM barrel-domain containing protein n=1 Tax=Nocardia sp. NPDC050697 TaxID=3155158 RepID=UPI0033CBDF89
MTEHVTACSSSAVELVDWQFSRDGGMTETSVRLPHDAMIGASRSADAAGGSDSGWFEGGAYSYRTTWTSGEPVGNRWVILRFEGVQGAGELFVDGRPIGEIRSGYHDSDFDLTALGHVGDDLDIRVEVDDRQHPRSRWYPGSGLFRPVRLLLIPPIHVTADGVRVRTRSFADGVAAVEVGVELHNPGADALTVTVRLLDGDAVVAEGWIETSTAGTVHLTVPAARPWSVEDPMLYHCEVEVRRGGELLDRRVERTGLRTVSVDSRQGLRINGRVVLLRGACVHHDHGVLGAAGHRAAEFRRVRLLKEAGFNALRSSHNPASRELLDACDELGMYVLDELSDHWSVSKTPYDRADRFTETWRTDAERAIAKNRNRPSVILLSIGNEIPEHGSESGTALTAEIARFVRERDPDRHVTAAVNLFLSVLTSIKAGPSRGPSPASERGDTGAALGSTMANMLMNKLAGMFDLVARTRRADRVTRDSFAHLDVAGYNYALGRYRRDARRRPDRVILGTETLPGDVARAWQLVRELPSVIGDFVWTGWDYLGEAGIGVWMPGRRFAPLAKPYPYLVAGSGMFDITGRPDTSLRLAQAAWGGLAAPAIAVRPLDLAGVTVAKVAWRSTDAVQSWSWQGCVGRLAQVEVYSADDEVELIVNGRSVGRRKPRHHLARFALPYEYGVVVAVGYRGGRETGRSALRSSTGELELTVVPEAPQMSADGADLAFIGIQIADADGVVEMLADTEVTLEIEGPAELVGFGSADPAPIGSYVGATARTYRGRALAVLRSIGAAGTVRVTARSPSYPQATAVIATVAAKRAPRASH